MTAHVLRAGTAALATSALLMVAGCAAGDAQNPGPTQTREARDVDEESAGPDGPVEVPDVTVLILETATGNLTRLGLEVEVVDDTGAAVAADDPTGWIVTAQDPAEGTVEPGTTVTLTVAPR